MLTVQNILLVFTVLTAALMAGLFYAYTCSVIPGLKRLPDRDYLAAMQSINRAILNPVFFASFFGVLLLLPASTYRAYGKPVSAQFLFLLTATIIYYTGVLGITVAGNIPLNNSLERFNIPSAPPEAIAAQRKLFEKRWNNLNTIRTIASTLAVTAVILACLNPG